MAGVASSWDCIAEAETAATIAAVLPTDVGCMVSATEDEEDTAVTEAPLLDLVMADEAASEVHIKMAMTAREHRRSSMAPRLGGARRRQTISYGGSSNLICPIPECHGKTAD